MNANAEPLSLRGTLRASPGLAARHLWGAAGQLALADIAAGTALGGALTDLAGRAVLLRVADPLYAAIALIELDGVARRIVICPPDLADDALPGVIEVAGVEAIVSEMAGIETHGLTHAPLTLPVRPLAAQPRKIVVVADSPQNH